MNGLSFGPIRILHPWFNTLKGSSRELAINIKLILNRHLDGQFFICPVGSVQAATLRALFHPLLNGGGQCFGNPPRLARSPLNLEAGQTPLVIALEPEDNGTAVDP